MRKFYLYKICAGERVGKPVVADGFANAEKQAKELLEEIWPNSPCDDTYIACVEKEFDMQFDHLIMQKDIFNEVYWKMLVVNYIPLYDRLLEDDEEEWLQELREEKEYSINDLSYDELIRLRGEVAIGSCFLADYENSWFIDTNEVSDACDSYEEWCVENELEDTPNNFAYFIQEHY